MDSYELTPSGRGGDALAARHRDVREGDKVILPTQLRRDSKSLPAPPVIFDLIMAVTFMGPRNAGFSHVFMNI